MTLEEREAAADKMPELAGNGAALGLALLAVLLLIVGACVYISWRIYDAAKG